MSKSIRVSEEFHALVSAHNREGETMEETLRRLTRGPDPEVLATILAGGDEVAAAEMREAIEARRSSGRRHREELRERFGEPVLTANGTDFERLDVHYETY